ncbi:MurR/RpiR family transcriptional regulator [Ruegeria sp. R8_1]|uniref:MurR/RpiR family transcriptional regulator n=2 Tax=unclassified Ruegeria TaxID=2625375 RepID=UPI0032AF80DA
MFFYTMPDTPTRITHKLRDDISSMPPGLQAAAKYIIDHPGDFALDSIRVTANNIGVSPNVLVRLAQRMGYDGFEAFRTPFRKTLVTDQESQLGQEWLDTTESGSELDRAQVKFAHNSLNVVTRSLRLMQPAKVSKAIHYITESNRCFVTATRASHALAYYFSYAGRMAHPGIQLAPRHSGSVIDDLLDSNDRDCLIAITFHPYSAETIAAMRFATQRGLKVILISESDVIAPGIEPDVVFQVSTRSQHHFSNFAGATAVLDCLLGHLFETGGEDARKRVERYQKAREDTGAYWQPSKLPRLRRS